MTGLCRVDTMRSFLFLTFLIVVGVAGCASEPVTTGSPTSIAPLGQGALTPLSNAGANAPAALAAEPTSHATAFPTLVPEPDRAAPATVAPPSPTPAAALVATPSAPAQERPARARPTGVSHHHSDGCVQTRANIPYRYPSGAGAGDCARG